MILVPPEAPKPSRGAGNYSNERSVKDKAAPMMEMAPDDAIRATL